MGKSWVLCVLLGTLAWGQAQPGMAGQPAPPTAAQAPGASGKTPAPAAEDLPETAVVLTIKGVCPAQKTTVPSKTAATKASASPTKKPADCKTEITRAEFEKIASGLSPTVTPQLKRQLETALPRFMAMSEAAKAKGLDKSPRYQETLKIAKMQILTTELQRSLQEEADKVPPQDIEKYYKENQDTYEQFSLDRLFIPRFKTAGAEEKEEVSKDPEDQQEPEKKLSPEEQKAKQAEEQARREKGEQELNKLADSLRARAAAGEDFGKLQKEAYEASGTKVQSPAVNLPKVRRTGLPAAHSAVFDLKTAEVSAVITDNAGHYVYKVVSKEVLSLDQVKDEIHNKLKSERLKQEMDEYTNSFQAVPNEAYFGAAMPAGMPGRPGMMGQGAPMRPQMATPPAPSAASPATNPPAQTPAQPSPPSKPN